MVPVGTTRIITRALSSVARMRAGAAQEQKRICLSLSSWFCVPEQGMQDMDILCRSSAFVLPVHNKEKFKEKSLHVITCSHVVAPWKWPKYYPAEWLQAVNESHTYYTVEVRHSDGVFHTQLDLLPRVYHHPTRDLAVLHFEDEQSSSENLSALNFNGLSLVEDSEHNEQERLFFHGHDVTGPILEDGTDMRVPIPNHCEGRFSFATPQQTFAKTARLLNDGMCGGPMVIAGSSSSSSSRNDRIRSLRMSDNFVARGMLEGIIPEAHPEASLRGQASFISAKEIAGFLDEIEEGKIMPIQGGKSAEIVGKDQDPKKMSFDYIANHDKIEKDLSPERRAELEEMKRKAQELLKQHSNESSPPQPSRNRDRKNKNKRD